MNSNDLKCTSIPNESPQERFMEAPAVPRGCIHAWSGPRSLSTATMYSFSSRPDCRIFDEPLYPNYLRYFPELHRPYREEFLSQNTQSGTNMINFINQVVECSLVNAKNITKRPWTVSPTWQLGDKSTYATKPKTCGPMEWGCQ